MTNPRTSTRSKHIQAAAGITCSLIIMLATGCAQMGSFYEKDIPVDEDVANHSRAATCQVVIDSQWGDPQRLEIPITERMTVQDVLAEADAIRRFGKIEVEVHRVSRQSRRMMKLPVNYETRERRVSYEQNYAILPNDRIVVRHAESSPLDSILGGMMPGR